MLPASSHCEQLDDNSWYGVAWRSSHTVEDVQKFSQLHTPIPPSGHVIKVSVPLSCCADAARALIGVFGGEDEAKRVLGGVRWWQVRPGDQGYVFLSLVRSFE